MSLPSESTPTLSPEERRELLARMMQERAARPAAAGRPLSPGQERLWLLARLEPESPCTTSRSSIGWSARSTRVRWSRRSAGSPIATRCCGGVPRRRRRGGRDHRRGAPALPTVSDLRDVPEGLREARVAEAAAEAARRPFDLDRGPLWRLELLRWADEGHDLVLVMHHLVSDAWSFAVFGRELAEGYASAVAGRPPGLADLPISYAEFGQRQRRWLSGPSSAPALEFWRGRLAGEVPSLWLPADRPGGSTMDHRGSFRPVSVPSPTASALAELSRREQATPFMTLLAAFAALLHRRGGQEDQVHCTPASGRHRSGARDLIGYFNNILPLRLDLRGDPPFVELVRQARRVAIEAYKHQDLPFQIIADAPNLGAVRLGRVLFSLDMVWPPGLSPAGLACTSRAERIETSDFDLSASIWEEDGGLRGVFEYKTVLFDGETIERLIADFVEVLAAIAEDPERRISTLPGASEPAAGDREAESRAPAEYQPPRFPTELRVLEEWEQILGVRRSAWTTTCSSWGRRRWAWPGSRSGSDGSSASSCRWRRSSRRRTVRAISAMIRDRRPTSSSASALVPIRPAGGLPPLFLCEGIGIYYR